MAGLGRRTFAAGEVLTASNVMGYLQDQAVMNFAGTAARGSAIGSAVSEGMVSYLQDTDAVEVYDGAAWNSLAYATAIPRVGLSPIIPTGVTVSTGSGSYDSTTGLVTFTNARDIDMTGVFTSTYKNYKILINATSASTSELGAWFTNAGTNITTGWYGAMFYGAYTGASGVGNLRSNGNGGWAGYNTGGASYATNTDLNIYIDSTIPSCQYSIISAPRGAGAFHIASYSTSGATTGFRISPLTGGVNITGTMKVYGCN